VTKLNERQRLILLGVLQDQRRLAAMPWGDGLGMSRDALGRHRLRVQYAREGMVAVSLEQWLGYPPSNSDHVLCCREYRRLEGMGLLKRCNPFGSNRTTHLKLTADGIRVAERLLADEYGLDPDTPPINMDELQFDIAELLASPLPAE